MHFMHFDKVPKVAVVVDPEIPYFGVGSKEMSKIIGH